MGCDVSGEQLWSWIDQDAPELEEHLAACSFCRARASIMRDEIGLLASDAAEEIPLPEAIGPYRVRRLLGEGGQALVYEAEQPSPRRLVALKVLKGGFLVDKTRVRHFRRETQTLAHLNHPAIATIYEAGRTQDGLHYFAMELVDGLPLHAFVKERAPRRQELLSLFVEVCRGVHYAHEHGVIHRDLKPSNIIVARNGNPKILDFGLARLTQSEMMSSVTATKDARVEGTPRYMSPEQALGKPKEVGARSDVYALGVILYELLTGKPPADVSAITPDSLQAICADAPPRPSSIDSSLRGDLEAILLKALEKDPGLRYQSADDLARDVSRHLEGRPIEARRPSRLSVVRRGLVRHRSWVGVGLLVAVLTALGIWNAGRSSYDIAQAQRAALNIRFALLRDGATDVNYYRAEEAPSRFPGLPEAILVRAQAYCLRREQNSAMALLERELGRDPSSWPYGLLLDEIRLRLDPGAATPSQAFWNDERSASADAWYLRSFATLDLDRALEWAKEALVRDPQHALALASVAYLSEVAGDVEVALSTAMALIEGGHRPAVWRQYRVRVLAAQGRYQEAIDECDEWVKAAPKFPTAYFHRAKIARRLRRYGEAESDLTRAVDKFGAENPQAAWLYYHRGTMRWMLGQRDGAIEDYRKAHEFLTYVTYADARLAILLRESGRLAEAEALFASAFLSRDLDPWVEEILRCLAGEVPPEQLARTAEAGGDPARLCEGYYYAGEAALLGGAEDEARAFLQRCLDTGLRFDPQDPLEPMSEFELAEWRLLHLQG